MEVCHAEGIDRYRLCDAAPDGRHPETPEFPIGGLEDALAEARDLNHDFANEIVEGAYGVIALFANGAAGRLI